MTLYESAIQILRLGVSVVPVDHRTKKPTIKWTHLMTERADEEQLARWFAKKDGFQSFAVIGGAVSGGLLIFDFDVPGYYERWLAAVGDLADGLPVQRTGGGGNQVFLRCPEPGRNDKLAWEPAESEVSGRTIAIETRAEGGYAVVPPSLHPTGNLYEWLTWTGDIPMVPQARADALIAAARKLDRMPYTKAVLEQQEAQAREAARKQGARKKDGGDVIGAYNRAHSIVESLERNGYRHAFGSRYIRPGGSRPLTVILEDCSFHHSSDDPLCDGRAHDSFDVFRLLEHAGDIKAAVRAAASELGMMTSTQKSAPPRGAQDSPSYDDDDYPDDTDNGDAPEETGERIATPGLGKGGRFSFTDTGNALRLARLFGDRLRYVGKENTWYWWDGARWRADETNMVFHYVDEVIRAMYREASEASGKYRDALAQAAHKLEGMSRQKALVAKAETLQDLAIPPERFDSHDFLITCRNVTLDLSSGEPVARAHDPQDLLTMMIDIEYDPSADCPRWEEGLDDWFASNPDLIQYINRAVGYSLTGDTGEQCLFFMYGIGKNGKSVFVETLKMLFGEYYGKAPVEMIMQSNMPQHTTDITDLMGKRFVVTSEVEENRRLNESRVKDLTGGDDITARRMRENNITFRQTHKLWMAGNHRPLITGTDIGIKRRIKMIPFEVIIPEEKRRPMRELLDMYRAELPGILNWALRGYMYYREGGMCEPDLVTATANEYFADMDLIGQFIDECCTVISGTSISVVGQKFWNAYQGWCDDRGEHAVTARRLFSKMRERGFNVTTGHGNKTMIYGIALNEIKMDGGG